jgi:hypothetical protein
MSDTDPSRTASVGSVPAGMPARLWEVAKHGARGTVPQWVRTAPDAGATAPPRIGQIARRAAQVAAAAGVGLGIGVAIGTTEVASRPVGLAHPGDDAHATDHTSTDPGTSSHVSSDTSHAPGPPGAASEEQVTLHTSSDSGHVATGLATTWRIPGHGAAGGEHGGAGAEGEHDGLTVEMYQDVVVSEGADGMFSVDAVEYVVVRDERGHSYVFHENYHTVVPDPPGQETDLVVHETDRVQVVEHPNGSFSVTQADNSISVTVGSSGDGQQEVTVTQTESVQLGHDPHADGHDTTSLTENESGSTTSDQTEVVTDQTLPPGAGETSGPGDGGAVFGTVGLGTVGLGTVGLGTEGLGTEGLGTAGAATSTAASSQVGTPSSQVETAPSTPGTFSVTGVLSTPPPLATSLGVAATTAGGVTPGFEPHPPGTFAGLRGGPAESGHGAVGVGNFANEPVPAQHQAGGMFDSASGSAASRPFEHPATQPLADTARPDPHYGAAFGGHDQAGLDEPGVQAGTDFSAVDPTEPGPSTDAHSFGESEEASGAHADSLAGSVHAPPEHDPGTDTTVLH